MINIMNYMRPLGLIAIFISAFTWGLELAHFVPACPYCQTQRTMMGLLGILMVLPNYRYISLYLAVVFGVYGIHVSCMQIFNNFKTQTFMNEFFPLASAALFIMVGQVLMLATRAVNKK